MIKLDPILAVKDVAASAQWYREVFNLKKGHGGDDFAVMMTEEDDIVLCLHKWGAHEHPPLTDPTKESGNGLLLYFRTDQMEAIRERVVHLGVVIEEELRRNPNSLKKEFSIIDPDGYFLTITEYHTY